jgi:serine/threonine protein kinase
VLNRRIECNTIGPWFSEREVSRIIGSVVSALSFLHQKKVIHGNVRPEHILYSDPGADSKVVLADFGRAGDISTFSLKNRTREGSLWEDVHELRFLPPFVVQQKQQTMKEWATAAQIDIWALGITCYILLCASFPFDGITLQEVERDILQKDLIFPNSGVVLSRAGKDLLSRILDRKSESSITNISELAAHPWINQNLASDATWDCDIVVKHQSFACSYLNKTSGLKRRMSSGVLSGMQLTDPTSSPELSEKPSYVSSDGVIVKGTSLPVTADGYMKQADAELLAAVDNDVRKRRDTDDAEIAVDLDILHTFYHQRRHNSVEENDLNP